MMSKAAFMLQDHLRRNYVMITDISNPNTFLVRGRLPFPQGLMAVAVLFKNKRPADVYAHPYFIEKQSDPSQPSPQLHLTEESQGIMKIMSGLRYMRDDNTKLDSTMVFVTDYKVPVDGRMPCVPVEAAEPQLGPTVPRHIKADTSISSNESSASSLNSKNELLTLEQRAMLRRNVHHVQQLPGGGGDAGLGLGGLCNPLAVTNMESVGGGRSRLSEPSGLPAGVDRSSSHSQNNPTAGPAWEQSTIPGYSTFPTPEECATDAWVVYRYLKAAVFGRRALKEEEEYSPAHRLNVPALFEHRHGGYTVLYNPIEVNEKTFTELLLKLQREERVVKAIVVPTRPAWRQLQIWADVFPDAELICSGEVPLVQVPGGVPNPKPNAVKTGTGASATAVAAASTSVQNSTTTNSNNVNGSGARAAKIGADAPTSSEWRGGCQDFGNGLTGLSFPEVDLEAEAAAERERVEAAAANARATAAAAQRKFERERRQQLHYRQSPQHEPSSTALAAAAVAIDSDAPSKRLRSGYSEEETDKSADVSVTAPVDPYVAQRRRQEEKIRLQRELAEEEARFRARPAAAAAQTRSTSPDASAVAGAGSAEDGEGEQDLVDVLWQDVSFFAERGPQPVGLRESDAGRLRILSPRASKHNNSIENDDKNKNGNTASPSSISTDHVQLTPTIELLRIPGDAATEEYVLYDSNSNTLACTDLYHGAYADLDPANSWMCRVWFKFMKRGDYKRTDIAPRYKWLQVLRQRSLATLQGAIEELTRTRPIHFLLFAHGTPPLQGEGVNLLRRQWGLLPLHPAEVPRNSRNRTSLKGETKGLAGAK